MKKYIFAVLLLVLPGAVNALGIADQLTVEEVRVDSSGKAFVGFSSALGGEPASCGTIYPKALAFNTNDASGRAILSLVLAAQATGKKVYAKGSGACDVYGSNVEDWLSGKILQ